MDAYPQQWGVFLVRQGASFALLNRGLPEFEAINTASGTRISLTLLRSVGRLGDPAGTNHPVPGAYPLGHYRSEYAVCLHAHRQDGSADTAFAHAYATPLHVAADIQHPGEWPDSFSLVDAEPGVLLMAFKQTEGESKDLVFGLWNTTETQKTVRLGGLFHFAKAWITTLDECIIKDCAIENGTAVCAISPFALITVRATCEPALTRWTSGKSPDVSG